MATLDLIAAARDEQFAARTAFLLMKAALDVGNEDPATTNHAVRLHFAQKVLRGEINAKLCAAACIAFNATLQTTIQSDPSKRGSNVPDSDLQFVLNGLIDMWANAYSA